MTAHNPQRFPIQTILGTVKGITQAGNERRKSRPSPEEVAIAADDSEAGTPHDETQKPHLVLAGQHGFPRLACAQQHGWQRK